MNFKQLKGSLRVKLLDYVELEEVYERLKLNVKPLGEVEEVDVLEACGRYLAEDVAAPFDSPLFDTAHFDGFAVRSSDTRGASLSAPVFLKLTGDGRLGVGEACYVPTGRPLPEGSDALIELEKVEVLEDTVVIRSEVKPWLNVTRRASDFKKQEVVFCSGRRLRPLDVKALHVFGLRKIKVHRKPTILIVPTGTELVEDRREDTHSPLVKQVLLKAGFKALIARPVRDDVNEIAATVIKGLERCDAVFTVGGASVGLYDHVWEAAMSIGGKPLVRGIKMVPGRVTSCVAVDGKPLVLLPGHVQSLIVGLSFIGIPAVGVSMMGVPLEPKPTGKVKLTRSLSFGRFKDFKKVIFVKLAWGNDVLAEPLEGDSSKLSPLVRGDGFTVVEKGVEALDTGSLIDLYRPYELYGG
ncbi:MAG: hypothetical protein DRN06_03265 [Thermoprotei archaeon]|nr:MAG: hypothetical protein DRN06_03265 [Thermoprotei archaeon]